MKKKEFCEEEKMNVIPRNTNITVSNIKHLQTADGFNAGQLRCKRRNGDKSMCTGILTCIGNECTPMKTPELARQRASQLNEIKLGHGYRMSCNVCGDKPPSETNPLKLRSWMEWCDVCREVWCNQSFHSKHGGLAKKGGEKKFSGRVKDHKKRLWAIYVAIWLMHKTNNNIFLNNWLNSSSGLASVLSPRVSPEEKARVLSFVTREIRTIQRYLHESSNVHNSSSSQTWPVVKKARKIEKPMNIEQCVLRRIPSEMNHERNWLLNMVRKFKYHTDAPVTLRDALNSMREDPSDPVASSTQDSDVESSKGECGDVGVVQNFSQLSFTPSPYQSYPASTFRNPMIVPAKSVVLHQAAPLAPGLRPAMPSYPATKTNIPSYPAMNMKKTNIPMHVTAVRSTNQTWPPTRKRERSPSFQKVGIPRQSSAELTDQAAKALMMMGGDMSLFPSSSTSSQTWSGQI